MATAHGRRPLLDSSLANPSTTYVGVPIHDGTIGLDIGWKDATAAATITLEFASAPVDQVATDDNTNAWEWKDSGETITGPTATAASGTFVHLENVRQKRARIKIVTTAISPIIIWDGAA